MVIIKSDAWFLINHASVFYSFGYNQYETNIVNKTIHAEDHAIKKLKKTKKRRKVDVIVFRICNSGKHILDGKPCEKCKKLLKLNLEKKGYRLNRVYYTEKKNNCISFIKKSNL